ncbi:MAG: gamma carbonic anhydrase family protein [Succiniclasticum sp.]|nr:gamma carbonic anhydrase family protein [Succiniclasticum sp.]MDY6087426.1 gamma carbonic anhydrase family protein [Succiniclasticum sp.]
MIETIAGKTPTIDKKAYVFKNAVIAGNVQLKEYSSVWYNATIRGDKQITIGRYTNIQDNACIHGESYNCQIGDYVTVGHSAIIHCCTIEDHCLIGMGATILDQCIIGFGSIVAAGSLVTKKTIIPPHSLVMGAPAKVVRSLDDTSIEKIHNQAVRYKTLWTKEYGLLPDCGGEDFSKDQIFS